ncbi:DEAD/DEAH box helicase [Ferrovibrio terrae]|uniref:DEAD/DEAH box helicase n=1 Tax=Ferrovibrio terrae TaxID=2594003 RepID=UPI00319E0D60
MSEPVLKAVSDAGYTTPTPIQAQAIPIVLMGRDVLGTAQTGTGKTAGFTLPLIDILAGGRARARMPRALILEPTRELADQVAQSFDKYGKNSPLSMALLIGGVNYTEQEKLLDRGVDVLIATPGRLIDHFERGKVMLTGVQIFVIDEADRMLDMGFMPDIERIGKMLPPLRQTLFFSATMAADMRKLADKFLSNPKEIEVARQATTAESIAQFQIQVSQRLKREALRTLIRNEDVKNAIIFCNRKRDVDILAKSLIRHGFDAAALHGDMDQSARTATLEKFKRNEIGILVASDVAARGLDVQGLTHVFNFDVPTHPEDYVHRIGRTGRAGMTGRAFTLVAGEDGKYLSQITRLIQRDIPVMELQGFAHEEGDAAATAADERAERGDRKEGRGRGRGGRGRDRDGDRTRAQNRSREPRASDASMEPTAAVLADATTIAPVVAEQSPAEQPVVEAVSREERKPRRDRSRRDRPSQDRPAQDRPRQDRPEQSEQPREARRERNETRDRSDRDRNDRGGRRDHREDREPPVIGMGDHVPEFMLRPSRRAS